MYTIRNFYISVTALQLIFTGLKHKDKSVVKSTYFFTYFCSASDCAILWNSSKITRVIVKNLLISNKLGTSSNFPHSDTQDLNKLWQNRWKRSFPGNFYIYVCVCKQKALSYECSPRLFTNLFARYYGYGSNERNWKGSKSASDLQVDARTRKRNREIQ